MIQLPAEYRRYAEYPLADAEPPHATHAATEAGLAAKGPADDEHRQGGSQPDDDRGARTVNRARVDVVALQVGAEPMRHRRSKQALAGIGVVGVRSGEQPRKRRDDKDQQDQCRGGDELRTPVQLAPGLDPKPRELSHIGSGGPGPRPAGPPTDW